MSDKNNLKSKSKYKSVDLETKYKIISHVSNGVKYNEIVKKYNLSGAYSVSKYVKSKEKIIRAYESKSKTNKIRVKEPKFKLIEALVKFLEEFRTDTKLPVTLNLLKEQALYFAEQFGLINEFKATVGWLQKFILYKKICGESASIDLTVSNEWINSKLQNILSGCKMCDVYNADEPGLYWRALPNNTLCKRR
jgi:ERCC4-related helicase